ncbi:hypothetical protein [Phenylobacterium sp.]|uniref:hypothetical protein n=1 Tax=Phenylobacterium sp. TaxID=1871053 RepID=UPI00286D0227|nr:hypothetical protein [Phenylobacterium sp.]
MSLSHPMVIAAATPCEPPKHWDPNMGMCMTGGAKTQMKATAAGSADPVPLAEGMVANRSSSSPCPSGQRWDPGMNMCAPNEAVPKTSLRLHLNQFAIYSNTTGPRGRSRTTGPGTWMLTYGNDITPKNHLSVDVMASPEPWTVGGRGTPQLLQTEHIDNMHAHDTIMALEFRDAVVFGPGDGQKLTFLFAPRGQAASGPVPFMHRESAEGNPDAPLGHALQDGFHDASTVVGVEYQVAHTTFEVTGFSGKGITRPFPIHRLDSYGVRVNRDIRDHVRVGASFADVLVPDDAGVGEHNQFVAAWLTTSHGSPGATLKTSFIWGETRAGHDAFHSSFLAEAVYQQGKNSFYGRAETLQVTPNQLELLAVSRADDARWVEAFTLGYERTFFTRNGLSVFGGGSYTKDLVPSSFRPAYGPDPAGAKLYMRIRYMGGMEWF